MKVYLAGGMRTEWREAVRATVLGVEWLDPTTHGLEDPPSYTAWDISAIRDSDVVFAYLAEDNPYGYNMAFELGVAYAWGKEIVFIDEKFAGNPRPCSMLREVSRFYPALEDAIKWLVETCPCGSEMEEA